MQLTALPISRCPKPTEHKLHGQRKFYANAIKFVFTQLQFATLLKKLFFIKTELNLL